MIAESREKLWIVGGLYAAKAMVHKCLRCRYRAARPAEQQMADLPRERVTPGGPPFTHVGVDYFGPLLVKVGRRNEKRYGCLFTCLKTRAVHVEVAHSLDTASFLMSLDRFISRRGVPELIRSDNGTNFVAGERELKATLASWNHERIAAALTPRHITWIFNVPQACHAGGVWERQIRTVRRILAGLVTAQRLTDEALQTFLTIAEGIINNRPLTPVSDDPKDLEALTPNHLLLLRAAEGPRRREEEEMPAIRYRWRQVQHLADCFWKRWVKEYLPLLRHRTKWHREKRNVRPGDLVLVMDRAAPRETWPLARVLQTFQGRDRLVRSALVHTTRGDFTRPIVRLCVLEEAAIEAQGEGRLA